VAVYQYDGPVRAAVHALKYDGVRAIASLLGALMAACPRLQRLEAEVVTPVPMHPARLRSRGYNQSDLLASEVAKRLRFPMDTRALRKVRNTPPQARSTSELERARQVAGAFLADAARVSGKRVLLVDDVATTCSTLNACAGALKAAGAAWAGAIVLAREV
jgi:ComF family protein